jgi:hypothetical protein
MVALRALAVARCAEADVSRRTLILTVPLAERSIVRGRKNAQNLAPPAPGGSMTPRSLVVMGATVAVCLTAPALQPVTAAPDQHDQHAQHMPAGLIGAVRQATERFRDVRAAIDAGYASLGSCVTGPERGALGVHFGKGELIEDDTVDAHAPELLVYEPVGNNRMRLVAVEFIVIADAWNASHPTGEPPVLMGQHFQFVGTPNRYRLPAFYELHVWAWRDNPFGTFVDWNPTVSCDDYDPDGGNH